MISGAPLAQHIAVSLWLTDQAYLKSQRLCLACTRGI